MILGGELTNKVNSVGGEKLHNVYFFAEHLGRIDEITFLCKTLGVIPISLNENISRYLEKEGLKVVRLSRKQRNFKKELKSIESKCILLFSDTLSPYAQWVCNHKYSIVLYAKSLTSTNKKYFLSLSENAFNCSFLMTFTHKLLGFTGKIYGSEVGMLNCGVYELLKYIYYKVTYGYKTVYAGLPGAFAQKVFVPTANIKEVYTDNGYKEEKILVTSSFLEDIYISHYNKNKNIYNSKKIDVLFFSQPLDKRGVENWINEVECLVNDCNEENLNITILLHPRDDYSQYKHLESKATIISSKRTLDENFLYTLNAKLVVIKCSTTHLIPLVCNIPVAYINYKGIWPFCDMEDSFSKRMILDETNRIGLLFKIILDDESSILDEQKKYLRNIGVFDGNSIKKIKELILNVLG